MVSNDNFNSNAPPSTEVDLLVGVELISFAATPTGIGPFGASLLRWNVSGALPGVRVWIDQRRVSPVSSFVVQPSHTTTYHLVATAGDARKALGTATVSVDESSCAEADFKPFTNMYTSLKLRIEQGPETYWSAFGPDKLQLGVADDRIYFRMLFRQRLSGAPDLWVTLRGSFGIDVEDGRFIAVGAEWKGTAQLPTLAWAIFGLWGGLALALNDANGKATTAAKLVLDQLIEALNILVLPGENRQIRTAWLSPDPDPRVFYTACSDGELKVFAETLHREMSPG